MKLVKNSFSRVVNLANETPENAENIRYDCFGITQEAADDVSCNNCIILVPRIFEESHHRYSTMSHLMVMFGHEDMAQSFLPACTPLCLSLSNFWKMGSMEVLLSSALSDALRCLEAMSAAATELVVALDRIAEKDLTRGDVVYPCAK